MDRCVCSFHFLRKKTFLSISVRRKKEKSRAFCSTSIWVHSVSHQTIHLKKHGLASMREVLAHGILGLNHYAALCLMTKHAVTGWAKSSFRPELCPTIKPRPKRKRISVRFLIWPQDVGTFHHQIRLLADNSLCSCSDIFQESSYLQLSSTKKMFPSLNAKKIFFIQKGVLRQNIKELRTCHTGVRIRRKPTAGCTSPSLWTATWHHARGRLQIRQHVR